MDATVYFVASAMEYSSQVLLNGNFLTAEDVETCVKALEAGDVLANETAVNGVNVLSLGHGGVQVGNSCGDGTLGQLELAPNIIIIV